MGSQAKTHIIQTLKELYNIHTNMNKFISLLALAALSAAAPQYGGGGGGSQAAPSRNPQPQAPAPTCRTDFVTVWDTRYVETEKEVCDTSYVNQCTTEYKDDCEYQWEGQGASKVWAVIPGTCKSNPYDSCNDVQKSKDTQVPYQECNKVPSQKCVNVPE